MKIEGSDENVRTSNICPNKLQIDLSPFKSLKEIYIHKYPMEMIFSTGLFFFSMYKINYIGTN